MEIAFHEALVVANGAIKRFPMVERDDLL